LVHLPTLSNNDTLQNWTSNDAHRKSIVRRMCKMNFQLNMTRWLLLALFCFPAVSEAKSVTFTFVRPVNGQQVEQRVQTHSRLQTTFTQSQQLISSDTKNRKTEQIRKVLVIEGRPERTAQVQVSYESATDRDAGKLLSRPQPQPVAGKRYLVSRDVADKTAELIITYTDGTQPPADELAIVDANMQAVGKTNPIAQFLNGKKVEIGEQLSLPAELAAELLSPALANEAERVDLRLLRLAAIDHHAAAVFATQIVGRMNEQDQPSFDCHGEITIAVATCRTLGIDMKAKVSLTEERGPAIAPFEVNNVGEVAIQMSATYEPHAQ
jgi:hypothetical protein